MNINKNINLCEILKGHEGETFYSPIFGSLTFVCVIYPDVRFKTTAGDIWDINPNGKLYNNSDELCVFPSKDQRDWNKWIEDQKPKTPKFKIGQFVRSKRSGSIYKIIDNSDTDNYRFEGTKCPLSEDDLEDATPKTWSDLCKQTNCNVLSVTACWDGNDCSFTESNTLIEKSALALLKLYQLIEASYGGNALTEKRDTCFTICLTEHKTFEIMRCWTRNNLIVFHTREQADEFLSHFENIQLLKDYFMIN